MHHPPPQAPGAGAELESCLAAVEQRLSALGHALRDQDALAIEQHAAELHRALASAVQRFGSAARSGGVPPSLRRRLARASGKVAAQRDALARATAALDRAIDALVPGIAAASGNLYSSSGNAERGKSGGMVQA